MIAALIRKVVAVSPGWALAYILAGLGILSSIASDAGYVVLIPLGAIAYLASGRHPIAGLTLTFAAVAAAFGVNFIIAPLDGVLTEITNDAIHLSDPSITLNVTANLYFSLASSVLLMVLIAVMSKWFMEPRLTPYEGEALARGSRRRGGGPRREGTAVGALRVSRLSRRLVVADAARRGSPA